MEEYSPYALPWSTLPQWQAAHQVIDDTIFDYRDDLQHLFDLADSMGARLKAVGRHMTDLCSQTCPECQQICCRYAHVYFDFKDLLYLHFGPGEWPAAQTLNTEQPYCQYLGQTGCCLPRSLRPFICTWYICPAQSACLEKMAPSVGVFLRNSLKALKTGREQLQHDYVRITAALPTKA